jgi:ornithine cyclodeaminase
MAADATRLLAMRVFDAQAIQGAVSMTDLLDAVEGAYRHVSAGRDRSPIRASVRTDGGTLLLMPGVRDGGRGTSVKLVTVMPGNAERGLPVVQAAVTWFDGSTGAPLAVLDGTVLTAMRTGAASGVATRLLARRDSAVLAMIGCGGQAAWQVRAVCAARPIREVRAFARDRVQREAFAAEMASELGDQATVMTSPTAREAVSGADVICCATTSASPVFKADWVAEGSHVNGIGAFTHDMVELPPDIFGRASLVAVDSREAALAEAGDLVAALRAGALAPEGYLEIGSVDRDWAANRDPAAITVFKSVGLAIQDLAVTELVAGRLLAADGAEGPVGG